MHYTDIELEFSDIPKIAVLSMQPTVRPCFTINLLQEIIHAQLTISKRESDYLILKSNLDGIFNFGGDVGYFRELILKQDRTNLQKYMRLCIEALEPLRTHSTHTRIAVVQGSAYGGGFEAALCVDIIIAEKQSKFAFPEVKFNLFPGMGAYTYITRKTDLNTADKIIQSGQTFSASELYDLGLVDILCEEGEGVKTAHELISTYESKKAGYSAFRRIEKIVKPLNREELFDIGEIWVDHALKVSKRDLRLMEAISNSQTHVSDSLASCKS